MAREPTPLDLEQLESPGPDPSGCRVELVPGGPALVRGADSVRDRDGDVHPVTRPVVAVCRCGFTQRHPWCDATHKVARRIG